MTTALPPGPRRRVAGGVLAALGALAARRVLDGAPPGGTTRWTRANHAGSAVTLLEGPALVAGLAVGAAASGPPAAVLAGAALAAGGLGALDDLAGDARAKGLRGHLGALRRGEVTTGAVKVAGLGLTGLAVAAAARRTPSRRLPARAPSPGHLVVDLLVDTALVAGTANLLNLLDLRPGRALKAAGLLALPGAVRGAVPGVVVVGAVAAALPDDLAGRSMMGDAGANALGAVLGAGTALTGGRATRVAAAAAVVALTLASERVSFTRVIAATPPLRVLDEWGRPRPTAAPDPS
ncbi:hypothetical protein [Lapillicoccus jejuensis]|uniref:UDP-N-acetylmuramyl pentapeptide phosphotransferase/UDP-N-acetylglucosamine-1-phosphate transferase n=1 Tax=Lapillicoccus jejuensis TaxID=402171 RepID=A0A542E6K9_9MICO|nr:hypothetical protein [Lapillicoccus jejuensis]TQJ10970.1 hypothetical protein FB458_4114 [Lapillicoccus jejuensis]